MRRIEVRCRGCGITEREHALVREHMEASRRRCHRCGKTVEIRDRGVGRWDAPEVR
ncbi:MAG: hypothetical protein ACOC8B_08460 [Gemmatimonadota bacterium]